MNTKRQTVWLVSMLSLMVVLSAYYLFTEDVNDLDLTSKQAAGNEIKVDTIATGSATKANPASADPAADEKKGAADKSAAAGKATTDNATDKGAAANKPAPDAKATAGASTGAKTDEEVLKQVTAKATSGSDYFAAAFIKRNEELAKQTEKLISVQLDAKKSSEEVTQAMNELQKLQDQDEKVTSLEDQLAKDFHNAIVLQESGRWKVVVQAAKLEKSQGVSIVDLVMKEMNVAPDKVTVQYVK
ncbi:SpoIIIAH-like family protein [Paenibacillus hodogayensis]|uniref:SpoIIIAH-like family protein n=1 Tax=Paenibacillus hodogayensis TaxID=279208 RepID=A0ABV5W647_9BACL